MRTISDQLRLAVHRAKQCGWTHYMLAKHAEMDPRQLDLFMSGERDNLRGDTIDRLCRLFKMQLTSASVPQLPPTARKSKAQKKKLRG